MKIALVCSLFAISSVACALPSSDSGSNTANMNAANSPPPDDRQATDQNPGDEEGPSCQDPAAVTPAGWSTVDLGAYTVAVPTTATVKNDVPSPDTNHTWYLLDSPGGNVVGYLQAAVDEGVTTLEGAASKEVELGGPANQSWTTHECRKDLVSTDMRRDSFRLFHHVVVDGKIVLFGCNQTKLAYKDICAQFIASFHVK